MGPTATALPVFPEGREFDGVVPGPAATGVAVDPKEADCLILNQISLTTKYPF